MKNKKQLWKTSHQAVSRTRIIIFEMPFANVSRSHSEQLQDLEVCGGLCDLHKPDIVLAHPSSVTWIWPVRRSKPSKNGKDSSQKLIAIWMGAKITTGHEISGMDRRVLKAFHLQKPTSGIYHPLKAPPLFESCVKADGNLSHFFGQPKGALNSVPPHQDGLRTRNKEPKS
jgi:hypothetical protein